MTIYQQCRHAVLVKRITARKETAMEPLVAVIRKVSVEVYCMPHVMYRSHMKNWESTLKFTSNVKGLMDGYLRRAAVLRVHPTSLWRAVANKNSKKNGMKTWRCSVWYTTGIVQSWVTVPCNCLASLKLMNRKWQNCLKMVELTAGIYKVGTVWPYRCLMGDLLFVCIWKELWQ